jgi:catechol 2,3-dioxygenase-like lactoylglutathione lyase family enzyme
LLGARDEPEGYAANSEQLQCCVQELIMTIQRVVPNLKAAHLQQSREFYVGFLGFKVVMERNEIITFASSSSSRVQLSVIPEDEALAPSPTVSIEVTDVNEVHAQAFAQNIPIVYPLTDKPWGVRHFFVLDPYGVLVNIFKSSLILYESDWI